MSRDDPSTTPGRPGLGVALLVAVGLSGASALMFEVVWTRTLSTVMGSSTHALSTMLAAFMAGLSVGGGLGAVASRKVVDAVRAFALCELGIGVAGLVVGPLMHRLTPIYISTYFAFHESFAAFYAVQFVIAFLLMGVPTALMGMTFPLTIRLFSEWRGEPGRQAGRLYAVNTLGGIAGSLAAGFALIPAAGLTRTVVLAAALNVANGVAILALRRRGRDAAVAAAVAVLALAGGARASTGVPTFSYGYGRRFASPEVARRVAASAEPGNIVFHDEGVEGDVWLMRSGPDDHRAPTLINGSKLEGGENVAFDLLAEVPYFTRALVGPARRVLSIGLGSGRTLRGLARLPVQAVDSVELNRGILEANRRYLSPELFSDARIRHVVADGRNHLLVGGDPYDLIVVSPSWATDAASAGMLTDEFFTMAARRLGEGGVIGVWVDFSMMDDADMSRLLRTFAKSFRHVTAWQVPGSDVVLVGANGDRYAPEEKVAALVEKAHPSAKGSFQAKLTDAVAKPTAFDDINTDDLPVLEFHNARHYVVGPPTDPPPHG